MPFSLLPAVLMLRIIASMYGVLRIIPFILVGRAWGCRSSVSLSTKPMDEPNIKFNTKLFHSELLRACSVCYEANHGV